jgi:hypothetical protein
LRKAFPFTVYVIKKKKKKKKRKKPMDKEY